MKKQPSSKPKTLYCLWIIPPVEVTKLLNSIIKKFSKKYKSPVFEPHVTLLDGIYAPKDKALSGTKELFSQIKPFSLSFGEVSFSTTYYQCVFVRIKATAPLMHANLLAKKIFNAKNDIFMPHISLLYGNHPMKLRERLAAEINLPKVSFKSEKMIVVPSTDDPRDWKHLVEYNF